MDQGEDDALFRIEHVSKQYAAASLVDANRKRLGCLSLRLSDGALLVAAVGFRSRVICARKFPHQCISGVIVKVHTSNISIVESAGTSSPFVIVTTSGTIESATCTSRLGTAAAVAGESRSLEGALSFLPLEPLEEVCGGFRGELIVTESNPNGTPSKIEAIHLLQGFLSLVWIPKSEILSTRACITLEEILTERNHSLCFALAPPSVIEQTRARRKVRRHSVSHSQ